MGRPPKYATAKEAAHNNLYSKMAGQNLGLSLERFIHHATGKCKLCGQLPQEALVVDRSDGGYTLLWHYVMLTEVGGHIALCKLCRTLVTNYNLKDLLSHCARIMARRSHGKIPNQFLRGQD